MGNVYVRLKARCYVNREVREAGETVELNEEIASHFGEVLGKVKDFTAKPAAEKPDKLKKRG